MEIIPVYFFSGLAFFILGLAVLLEARRGSELPFGRQLPWLATFGLLHSLVEWSDMFLLWEADEGWVNVLQTIRTILLPLSALFLIRFGVGLISEAGPLPGRLTFVPVVLLTPLTFLLAFALIVSITSPILNTAAEVWSRYLLVFSGGMLSSLGFIRQWRALKRSQLFESRNLVLGAAVILFLYAVIAGLVAPVSPYGIAQWVNYESVSVLTKVPIQIWRLLVAILMTLFILRSLDVFDAERKQELENLRNARELDRRTAFEAQAGALNTSRQWTNALVDTSRKIANLESVDTVLLYILDLSRRLLESDVAAMGLWDASGEHLELEYHAGESGTRVVPSMEITNPVILKAVKQTMALRYPEDISAHDAIWLCETEDAQINAAAVVPLKLETQSVGGLWIGREGGESYRVEDLNNLEHLADQAVIALEHAIMTERMQSVAAMEERTRIAHEMHDNLAQILAFLSVEMQTLEAYVKQGDTEYAMEEIQQARIRINEAQADVRENILSLRTTLAGNTGVIPALREFISEYAIQTGIDAQLNCDIEDIKGLSPIAETQLIYIVQEALANVRKHAQAEQATVDINMRDDRLYITVSDDGVGSGVLTSTGHFGIQTMQERAESIGGRMTIDSHPGEGTNIRFWLPILQSAV